MSRTPQLNDFQRSLDAELKNIADIPCSWTEDVAGNRFCWLHLPEPMLLLSAAAVLHEHKARLVTITAYAEERDDQDKKRNIAYHFVVNNTMMTVTIRIYDPKTFEILPVPSITSMFRNADWNEREFHEMFNIEIINHPNPKRLFLDERLDAGIMSSLIPFSTMANGMSSQGLWERVMEEKAGYTPSLARGGDNAALAAGGSGEAISGGEMAGGDLPNAQSGDALSGNALSGTALSGDSLPGDALPGTVRSGDAHFGGEPQGQPAFTPVSATASMTEQAAKEE